MSCCNVILVHLSRVAAVCLPIMALAHVSGYTPKADRVIFMLHMKNDLRGSKQQPAVSTID